MGRTVAVKFVPHLRRKGRVKAVASSWKIAIWIAVNAVMIAVNVLLMLCQLVNMILPAIAIRTAKRAPRATLLNRSRPSV